MKPGVHTQPGCVSGTVRIGWCGTYVLQFYHCQYESMRLRCNQIPLRWLEQNPSLKIDIQ